MGRRFFNSKLPSYLSFTQMWINRPGFGKYYKRCVNKSRRRAWKQGREWRGEKEGYYRGSSTYEGNCNYKSW